MQLRKKQEYTGNSVFVLTWADCTSNRLRWALFPAGVVKMCKMRRLRPGRKREVRRSESYAISVDTMGKLRWSKSDIDGDHLICVVSEQAPADYLSMLRDRGISYVVSGATWVDLPRAVDLLGQHFGIRTLLLEGGGHINGSFLEQGLVDEVRMRSAFYWRRASMAGTRLRPSSVASSPEPRGPYHSG